MLRLRRERGLEIAVNSDELEIFREFERENRLKIDFQKEFSRNRTILNISDIDSELEKELLEYETFQRIYYEPSFYRVGTSFILFIWGYMLYEAISGTVL